MRRREFILGVGGASVLPAFPVARAQEAGRRRRVGILSNSRREGNRAWQAFLDELGRGGFVEGGNLDVDDRGFGVAAPSLEAVAIELARRGRMLSWQSDSKPRVPRSTQREASRSWRPRTTW